MHGCAAPSPRCRRSPRASPPPPCLATTLVVLVDRTARESGLSTALTGQTPAGQSAIRVRLESAAFDAMLQWLGTLQQAHAVSVESATIDRTAKPGLVDASLVLNRAGG